MINNEHVLYSQLPAIDNLLKQPEITLLVTQYGKTCVVNVLRDLQQQARFFIRTYQQLPDWSNDWSMMLQQQLQQMFHSALQPVFNLTGTLLHTNLGRALLSEKAIGAVTQSMRHAITLEYDLTDHTRGHRDQAIGQLLQQLTGAEAACIVNNNAAAVLLILATLAAEGEVIVSRGELVEIGGAFRIPDVMRQAHCQLIEVGTTNRTYLQDYQQAITPQTRLLMKVHPSNYSIEGFTSTVSEAVLASLGQKHQLPVVVDLGSGSLVDLTDYGMPAEPMPQTLIQAGVDLVCFSGDKLLGGPQAGIIIGRKRLIEQLQHHPLKRALRADKLTLSALEATLQLYLCPEQLTQQLPTLYLLTRPLEEIHACGHRLLPLMQTRFPDYQVALEPCLSQIGSGALPTNRLASYALTFHEINSQRASLLQLMMLLRRLSIPIIGRVRVDKLWLDLRALLPTHEVQLMEVLSL